MGEIDGLLKQSIKEFQDGTNNATAIPCAYLPGTDGLAYLVKDLDHKIDISAAVHLSAEVKQAEDGIYDTGYVAIDTQDDIFAQFAEKPPVVIVNLAHIGDQYKLGYSGLQPYTAFAAGQVVIGATSGASGTVAEVSVNDDATSGILFMTAAAGMFQDGEDLLVGAQEYAVAEIYDGFVIGVSRSGEFNEVAQTWHYTGELLLTRNSQFLILEEPIGPVAKMLTDSTTLWLDLATEFGIPVFPSFISTKNVRTPFISVMISESKAAGPVDQREDLLLQQFKKDQVRLFLVNADANQAQLIAQKIWNAPLKQAMFGINGPFPGWQMIGDRIQSSFGLKQNARTMDLMVNYKLVTDTQDEMKYILKFAMTVSSSLGDAVISNIN